MSDNFDISTNGQIVFFKYGSFNLGSEAQAEKLAEGIRQAIADQRQATTHMMYRFHRDVLNRTMDHND